MTSRILHKACLFFTLLAAVTPVLSPDWGTAQAQTPRRPLTPYNSNWVPPPEYDVPYLGHLTIVRVAAHDMPFICPKNTVSRHNGLRLSIERRPAVPSDHRHR
jgi:hypothetical protein